MGRLCQQTLNCALCFVLCALCSAALCSLLSALCSAALLNAEPIKKDRKGFRLRFLLEKSSSSRAERAGGGGLMIRTSYVRTYNSVYHHRMVLDDS